MSVNLQPREMRLSPRGFGMMETVLAFAIVTVALVALYSTVTRGLLLSETNKQVKIAYFHAQTIVEEIMGAPFDQIMDPDYPTELSPQPRFRHMQELRPLITIFGAQTDTSGAPIVDTTTGENIPRGLSATQITERVWFNGSSPGFQNIQRYMVDDPRVGALSQECVTVTYGTQLDTSDVDGDGDTSEVLSLPIVTNSYAATKYVPASGASDERFRPKDNDPVLGPTSFITPDPLYFTAEVTWLGPEGVRMSRKLTAVRSR